MTDAQFANFLYELALEAGAIMLKYWTPDGVDFMLKGDKTRVTFADTEISAYVHKLFQQRFPKATSFSEEGGYGRRCGIGVELCIDEIDGTDCYSRGGREAVFAGAMLDGHVVQSAIVHAPLLLKPRMFTASLGCGTFLNGKRVEVSRRRDRLRIIVGRATPELNPDERYHAQGLISHLVSLGHELLPMYSSSYSVARLACGEVDAVLFPWDDIHDMCMGHRLVIEAGGVASTLDGKHLNFKMNTQPGYLMANSPDVHQHVLSIAKAFRRVPDKEKTKM